MESYVSDIEGTEGEAGSGAGRRRSLLLVNKADLLTKNQRRIWADYFDSQKIRFAFYSAATAAALQKAELESQVEEENSDGDVADETESDEEEEDSDEDDDTESSPDVRRFITTEAEDEIEEPRTRVLTVPELEELFIGAAPPLTGESILVQPVRFLTTSQISPTQMEMLQPN